MNDSSTLVTVLPIATQTSAQQQFLSEVCSGLRLHICLHLLNESQHGQLKVRMQSSKFLAMDGIVICKKIFLDLFCVWEVDCFSGMHTCLDGAIYWLYEEKRQKDLTSVWNLEVLGNCAGGHGQNGLVCSLSIIFICARDQKGVME